MMNPVHGALAHIGGPIRADAGYSGEGLAGDAGGATDRITGFNAATLRIAFLQAIRSAQSSGRNGMTFCHGFRERF